MNNLTTQPQEIHVQVLNGFSESLKSYLNTLGLPDDNVLIDISERAKVINNLPHILKETETYDVAEAMYLSKMVAACAVGLFDAALNFLWDETVTNLRKKVSLFDLQYFFATAVPEEKQRKQFTCEDDLKKLDDWTLIRACNEVGLITDIAHKHLDYIRDMRNHASAAHPNQNDITGFQLVSYIELCIKEVLAREPDGSLIEIKRLLDSIRRENFSEESVRPVCAAIQRLPINRLSSLARSVFGMYLDPEVNSHTKNNIQLLLPAVWQVIDEHAKRELGLKYANFSVHGETARASLVRDLLQRVEGLAFLDENTKSFEIQTILGRLRVAHDNFNNFYTEGPIASLLSQYIPDTGEVPQSIKKEYVKILTICYIGNSFGVAWDAEEVYKLLVSKWNDHETFILCNLLGDTDLSSRLQFSACSKRLYDLLLLLKSKIANVALKDLLTFLLSCNHTNFANIAADSRFAGKLKNIVM